MSTTPEHANLIAVGLVLAAFMLAAYLIITATRYLLRPDNRAEPDQTTDQLHSHGTTLLGMGLGLFALATATATVAVIARWDASGVNPTAYEKVVRSLTEPVAVHITLVAVAAIALIIGIYLLSLSAINYSHLGVDALSRRLGRPGAPGEQGPGDPGPHGQHSLRQLKRLTLALALLVCAINLAVNLAI